ncbi:MAG: ABC transporter ATP-binding protein [Flavobacteriia bacterium]|nr:ABC transporter ATP-binding protein [Flavobacteriia bacterium]
MVQFVDLQKKFGKLEVLKGISEEIMEGECVAVLGPNGSGKSTLIKTLLGLVLPDKGDILIEGKSILKQHLYRNEIGYLPQIAQFPENMKVKELIRMITLMREKPSNENDLIDYFGVSSFLDNTLRSLSGGTKQKINAILALMFDCKIYVYDEPTVGLDPISRVLFKNYVQQQKKDKKTILLTTHLINEVEELADRILFILDGKIYYNRSVKELISEHNETSLENAMVKMLENHSKNKAHV